MQPGADDSINLRLLPGTALNKWKYTTFCEAHMWEIEKIIVILINTIQNFLRDTGYGPLRLWPLKSYVGH